MNDELPANLRPVVDFFGLPNTATVVKDFYVVKAIRAVAAVDTSPFDLVFGGGTALARAYKLVQRMSEDVDFKIVLRPDESISRSALRKQLGRLRERVTAALQEAGFSIDPKNPAHLRSLDENQYTVWHLPYGNLAETAEGLRPTIQVEMTYARLRSPLVAMPVSSFVAEAFQRAPEVASLACVSLTETAAEKLVSLTRRTAMELAGLSRDPDPTLVRHIYDLHAMRPHIDIELFYVFVKEIMLADAQEFRNQYAAYAGDIRGETLKATASLKSDTLYKERYDSFVASMVYKNSSSFEEALAVVLDLVQGLKF